jgi:hypothetical protein
MPVHFRFTKLAIRGFRGIRELDIDLPSGKPLYLIGGNNSGKSTVLQAAALALAGGGFHQFEPEAFDYFHDAAGHAVSDFTATMHMASTDVTHLPAVQGVGNPTPVHGIQVRGTTDGGGRLSHRRVLLDDAGKAITYSPRTALKGETKEAYKGRSGLGWSQPYARLDEIRSNMPDVWLLTPQNLHRSLYEWKTGPLQKLSRILTSRFLDTDWQFEYDGKRIAVGTLANAMSSRVADADSTDLSRLAWLYLHLGDTARAEKMAGRGLAMDPESEHCLRLIERLHRWQ